METAQENKVSTTVKDSDVIWYALFTTKMKLFNSKAPVPINVCKGEGFEAIKVPHKELLDIIERLLLKYRK